MAGTDAAGEFYKHDLGEAEIGPLPTRFARCF